MSDDDQREILAQMILEHFNPDVWGQWKLRPYDAADDILARFTLEEKTAK